MGGAIIRGEVMRRRTKGRNKGKVIMKRAVRKEEGERLVREEERKKEKKKKRNRSKRKVK